MIYEPEEDSYLLEKYVKILAKGKVLDMGTGSGILAIAAKNKCKEIMAVDINPEAVALVQKKGIKAIESDLFSEVEGKFDTIIFNPPYLPEDDREDEESKKITTGGKNGNELIERFLKQAKNYLQKEGIILIVFSSLSGDVNRLFKKYGYRQRLLESKKEISSEEIVSGVINLRKNAKLPMQGIAPSNIRRQIKRLRDIYIAEKSGNNYRISENENLAVIFEEKLNRKFIIHFIANDLNIVFMLRIQKHQAQC